ncbi:MAG: hypothetical protein HYR96_05990 [Deltaproteobacteria bacterium]|nr:hypothetical protein [Deltaproteobacteria bacterium]
MENQSFRVSLMVALFAIGALAEPGSRSGQRPAAPPAAAARRPPAAAAPKAAVAQTETDEEDDEAEDSAIAQSGARRPQSVPPRGATAATSQKTVQAAQAQDDDEDEDDEDEAEAEDDDGTVASAPAKDVENPNAKEKLVERLKSKLTLPNKKLASVVFLRPVNYVQPALTDVVLATMQKVFSRYGDFNIAVKNQKLQALTLEGFRAIMGKIKADVVFATVLKPTHFDIFIFDRRTPYYVFYYTEVNPEEEAATGKISEELAIDQLRVLMRRGLYLYLTNQFYELPRENHEVVMEAQIPRWMASAEMVEHVKNIIRYNISNKYSSYQIMPGLGGGYLTDRKALVSDRNMTLHKDYYYIIPSVSLWVPLGEFYFKAETQLQVALSGEGVVFQFMPGLLYQF